MLKLKTLCALVLCLVLPGLKLVSQSNVFALPFVADQHPRSERAVKFRPGPGGEDCELSDTSDDGTYDHTDENGNICKCELCREGYRLVNNCTCDPSQPKMPSICQRLDRGFFMSRRNKCRQGYKCKQCLYPMKEVSPCRPSKDTECGCVEGYCLSSSGDCLACPRNESGHDSVSGDANFTDGMDSNGMGGEVTHGPERVSPEDEDALHVDSPDDTKITDRPAVVVESSSSVENDDGVDPSTVPNDESIISTAGCPSVLVLVITHVVAFVLGIIVCYSKKLWETLRGCFQQGVYVPANQGNSLELGRAGGRGGAKKGKKGRQNRKRSQSRKKRQGQTNSTAV